MEKNVGGLDKQLRYLFGAILVFGGIFGPVGTPWRIGAVAVGSVALITAFTGL